MPISRTHRPRQFAEVTGQRHITETLRKEVETGILGHAFLFSGPRGVGKTTTARIFAKSLLCENPNAGEPDAMCAACREVQDSKCIDVIEIDAASHTGVDNIREAVIDHVRFAPARFNRKVYVIDECHMLSPSAWNALLKTLEEPPDYAFFILATTELHKVPDTIRSRCQRFEFHRIETEALRNRIKDLATQEGVTIDDDVVMSIVHAADGSVRDAESLLDQLISLGEKKITSEIAALVLPISRIPEMVGLLKIANTGDIGTTLQEAATLQEQGIHAATILDDLIYISRTLIRATDPAVLDSLKKGDVGNQKISELAGSIPSSELGNMSLMLLERRRDLKTGVDPSFALELSLLAIAGRLLNQSSPRVIQENDHVPQQTNPPPMTQKPPLKAQLKTKDEPVTKKIDIDELRSKWNRIVSTVEKTHPSLPLILKGTHPDSIEENKVVLRFQYEFHCEKITQDTKTRHTVESAIRTVLENEHITIEGVVVDRESPQAPQNMVDRVMREFGGSMIEE